MATLFDQHVCYSTPTKRNRLTPEKIAVGSKARSTGPSGSPAHHINNKYIRSIWFLGIVGISVVFYCCSYAASSARTSSAASDNSSSSRHRSIKSLQEGPLTTYDDDDDDNRNIDDEIYQYMHNDDSEEAKEQEEGEQENRNAAGTSRSSDAMDLHDIDLHISTDDIGNGGDGPRPYILVYASDESSRPGVEASIRSVAAHATGPIEFLYVGETPLNISPNIRVHFLELPLVTRKYNLAGFANDRFLRHKKNEGLNTNPANFVRFVIHQLLPTENKAMWIDADTIIECDVYILMDVALTTPESDHVIAAVPREGAITGLTRRGRNYARNVGTTFNAGAFIVHLDRWRRQHTTELIRRITNVNRKYGLYYKGSQPPLALVVGENFEHLPRSWNVKMVNLDVGSDKALDWMCLMHFSGPNKPWNHGHEDNIHAVYWLPWGTPVEPEDLNGIDARFL